MSSAASARSKITINRLFLIQIVLEIVTISLIVVFHDRSVSLRNALEHSQYERFEMNRAADELRQSSDDLTRFARTYTVTGDVRYKAAFYKTLAIRNGQAPRPRNYETIYWDLLEPLRSARHPDEAPRSLAQIMDALPFSESERVKLNQAQLDSDALVRMEEEAFHAMEGRFKDERGRYTIEREPDPAMAVALVHSPAYHKAKEEIMLPIDEFMLMLDERTEARILKLQDEARRNDNYLGISILFFIAVNIAILVVMHRRVIGMIVQITQSLRASKGRAAQLDDLSVAADELGEMVEAYRGMQRTIDERTQLLEQNRSTLQKLNTSLEQRVRDEVERNVEVIREKNRQEQLLIQQSKMASMGEMLASIAHNWRQPLNAVGLLAQQLPQMQKLGLCDEAYLEENVGKIMKQLRYMSDTIDDFRNFFKPTDESVVFELHENINKALGLLESQLRQHEISVNLEVDPEIRVKGNPNQFRQAVLNILTNARDAIEARCRKEAFPEGKIRIAAEVQGAEVVLSFEDNGGGVEEAVLKRLFEPYFTTKEEGKGTGIGLYMTRLIVERHFRGSVEVGNRGEGFAVVMRLSGV